MYNFSVLLTIILHSFWFKNLENKIQPTVNFIVFIKIKQDIPSFNFIHAIEDI